MIRALIRVEDKEFRAWRIVTRGTASAITTNARTTVRLVLLICS